MAIKWAQHMHMPVIAGYVFNFDNQAKPQNVENKASLGLGLKYQPEEIEDSLSEDSVSENEDEESSSSHEQIAQKITLVNLNP